MKLAKEIIAQQGTEFYFYLAVVIFLTSFYFYRIIKEKYDDNHRRR